MTSNKIENHPLTLVQRRILRLVSGAYPQVYLVGGTAISLLYGHRFSEDLDFFTQNYSSKLHREIAGFIRRETGFKHRLIDEEKRKKYLPMAVYEFQINRGLILKVDFVSDVAPLFCSPDENGIADKEDLYFRKILAVIGWQAGESAAGKALAGGRQKTKDLFDVYFLSERVSPLSRWFPAHFDRNAYERLVAWYLNIARQKAVLELLDLTPGLDTKLVFKHLDHEIIHALNRVYAEV